MKKESELLFKVFKAKTGAKNDVWKEQHRIRHKNINTDLIGKEKLRYTIPVALLGKTKNKEKILLLIQTSTSVLNFNHFIIESDKFTRYLGVDVEYIYVFNTRIGLETELIKNSHGEYIKFGEIKKSARNEILNSSMKLIDNTKRKDFINKIINKQHLNYRPWELNNIVKTQQFSEEENLFRNYKNKNK